MDATARPGDGEAVVAAGVAREAAGLVEQLLGQLGDRVVLLQLELRRAAGALAVVLALALAGAILVATAWATLCAAAAWFAMQQGVGPLVAVAGVIVLNLALSFVALRVALRLLGAIGVPLTLHHLTHHATRESHQATHESSGAPGQAGWAP